MITVCGLTSPLAVDPASALLYGPSANISSVPATCASATTYTVQAGDTCQSIAIANSVAQGTLWAINNLTPDCSLMAVGESLCLPKQCDVYTLEPTDSCWSVALANSIGFSSLLGYNPTINSDCSNLNTTGPIICISNPQGDYYPPPITTGSSNGQGQYASYAVPAPGPVPFGTTTQCGGYYQVQVADICERISLSAGVSVDLFESINPSIDSSCSNLVSGLWYCVLPVVGWNTTSTGNSTTSSTTEAAPAPTPPGTTGNCFSWHVVVSGDTCSLLQQTLGITMAQLILWNPNLAADCSNLILGEAYCVAGPSGSSTSTVSPSLMTTTSSVSASKVTSAPTSSAPTSSAPTVTPTGVCVLGEGPDNFGGLCSFSCNFGFCPSPCQCTTYGAQISPPAGTDTVGFPIASLASDPDYIALCSFTCSHGYCPDGACTTDQTQSSVPGEVCVLGIGLVPNQAGLCSFTCNYGYCPAPTCICTEFGAQTPPPPSTGVNGVPIAGEDSSYSDLCAFACNLGYCPEGACTTV